MDQPKRKKKKLKNIFKKFENYLANKIIFTQWTVFNYRNRKSQ